MTFNLLTYYYHKYSTAESNEERFDVLIDFLTNTQDKYTEYFNINLDEAEFWNQYNINDYFFTNEDDIRNCWHNLIRNYQTEDDNYDY